MRTTKTIDFKSFVKGEYNSDINKYKKIITVGAVTLIIASAVPLPDSILMAATDIATQEGGSWDKLVDGLVRLLDPVARVFGIIAGIAIMTGNGKIGLERLFWLSIGYLTARKVEDWIAFLNTL